MSTRLLISNLERTLHNCEKVLFMKEKEGEIEECGEKGVIDVRLRDGLSSRQVAKLYGFTQRLLTRQVDQLGLSAEEEEGISRDEIRNSRRDLVKRCNRILDLLEEKNQSTDEMLLNRETPAMSKEARSSDSIHFIIVTPLVVYGFVYLSRSNEVLYVEPCSLPDASSCGRDISKLHALIENVILSSQQRLLDDGMLEMPSFDYKIFSHEGALVKYCVRVAIIENKIQSHSLFSLQRKVKISFYHPHELLFLCPTLSRIGDCDLILSVENSFCHASLVKVGEDMPHYLHFGCFCIKALPPQDGRDSSGNRTIPSDVFVARLKEGICHYNSETCWSGINNIHIIDGDQSTISEQSYLGSLEQSLVDNINKTLEGEEKLNISSHSFSSMTSCIDGSLCGSSSPPERCSNLGIRSHNMARNDDIHTKEDSQALSFCLEKNHYIPFQSASDLIPSRVKRRLKCKLPKDSGVTGSLNDLPEALEEGYSCREVFLDVVEKNVLGSYQFDDSGVQATCLTSILTGSLVVAAPLKAQHLELDVEIILDGSGDVSVSVSDDLHSSSLLISLDAEISSNVSSSSPNKGVLLFRRTDSRNQFAKELTSACYWESESLAAEYKQRGNVFMRQEDYFAAAEAYSSGLACLSEGDTAQALISNRCAAFTHLNLLQMALEDARDCVRLSPEWEKGWARLGSVLFRLNKLDGSLQAYEKGVSLSPTNATMLDALQEVRDVINLRKAEEAAQEAKKRNQKSTKDEAKSKKNCDSSCSIS